MLFRRWRHQLPPQFLRFREDCMDALYSVSLGIRNININQDNTPIARSNFKRQLENLVTARKAVEG